jgi:hypothetical protein
MTTPVLNQTATLRDLLFGEAPGEPVDVIAKSLHNNSTLDAFINSFPAPSGLVAHELAAATDGLLSMNLADIVADGWKTYRALTEAARHTLDKPNARESVDLVTHRIESTHRPNVELSINSTRLAVIEIELNIAFTIAGMRAVVEQARLTKIESGTGTAAGSLTIHRVEITKKQRQFDLPGVVRLGKGLPLLGPPTNRTVPRPRYADIA